MVSKAPVFFCHGICGEWYPASAFRKNPGGRHMHMPTRSKCKRCEQTIRDEKKWANRWLVKARTCIYSHARKFKLPRREFEQLYSWNADRLARDLESTYEGVCQGECGEPFKGMGHGLSDITVDINDPRLPPYYPSNTRFLCMTCNQSKGRTPPEEMGERMIINQRWKAAMQRVKADPLVALPLWRHALKA